MTSAILTFDTLQCSKRLREAGFTEQQAEVQAEVIKEQAEHMQEIISNDLATKADMKVLEKEIAEIKKEIAEIKKDINLLSYKLTVRLGSIVVAGIIVLGTIVKL